MSNSTAVVEIDTGDTAWMLVATALILFMTMPGLALYYSGLGPSKNLLATATYVFVICVLVTVEFFAVGYSLAFAPTTGLGSFPFFGDGSRLWLHGLKLNTAHQLAPKIPEAVYCVFQMTFAIITPALISGSFVGRTKFRALLVFILLWHVCVYCPIAHVNWHPDGFMFQLGVLDYAGGNVVHISSGIAGLMTAIVVGKRRGWVPGKYDTHPPGNMLLTFIGMSMLWVGWFGFNAGSAVAAGDRAAMAFLVTQISAGTGVISWLLTEWAFRGKPSVLGMINGAVAGLVTVTPACGYVDANGGFWIGVFGGSLCYLGSQVKHKITHVDDSFDAFGVHCIGGMVGGVLTGFFFLNQLSLVLQAPMAYFTDRWKSEDSLWPSKLQEFCSL